MSQRPCHSQENQNDCDGEVDEDCCPCWQRDDLDERIAAVLDNPFWDAACYEPFDDFWNLVVLGYGYDDAGEIVDYGGAGMSVDDSTCLLEWYDGTDFYQVYDLELSEGAAADCNDVLSGVVTDYGLTCE